jgi:TRAP-type transport system large permease protein
MPSFDRASRPVRPERVMVSTLPYTWLVGAAGLVRTAVLYLD